MTQKFKHKDVTLESFGSSFLVVCPKCEGRATVLNRGDEAHPKIRLTCRVCGHSDDWVCLNPGYCYSADSTKYQKGSVCIGGAVDWYFHLPLWLQTPCCGETLWAYNEEHLNFLENFVSASLREQEKDEQFGGSNRSLASRLPKWMQSAKNRERVLKRLAELRDKLN